MIIIYGQFLSFPCIWKLIVISGHQLKEPQASWFVNDLMYSYHYVQNCNQVNEQITGKGKLAS